MKTVKTWFVCQAIGLLALAVPCAAGIYGVPTNLSAAGIPGNGSANPPGFFNLDGLSNGFAGGDGVHQIRLKIEVTSTTLDVMIFDPGTSGARDLGTSTNTNTTYTLLNPAGTTIATVTIGNDTTTGTITDNRLVRLRTERRLLHPQQRRRRQRRLLRGSLPASTSCASPRRATRPRPTSSASTSARRWGARRTTTCSRSRPTTARPARRSSRAWARPRGSPERPTAGPHPEGNITQPLMLYSFVDRGCTIQTSNFDMDIGGGSGAGGSGSILDVLGASTTLTMSGGTAHSENTVTVETTAATNLTVENYGMYLITNNIGTQNNAVDWRISDFQGSTSAGANVPVQPVNPIRMYLPNGYTPTTGNPKATAPVEPILALSARVVSGANPPAAGQLTRFAVTATVANQTANAITGIQITVGHQANEANFSTTSGCVDGVGGPLCPTVTSTACTDASTRDVQALHVHDARRGQLREHELRVRLHGAGRNRAAEPDGAAGRAAEHVARERLLHAGLQLGDLHAHGDDRPGLPAADQRRRRDAADPRHAARPARHAFGGRVRGRLAARERLVRALRHQRSARPRRPREAARRSAAGLAVVLRAGRLPRRRRARPAVPRDRGARRARAAPRDGPRRRHRRAAAEGLRPDRGGARALGLGRAPVGTGAGAGALGALRRGERAARAASSRCSARSGRGRRGGRGGRRRHGAHPGERARGERLRGIRAEAAGEPPRQRRAAQPRARSRTAASSSCSRPAGWRATTPPRTCTWSRRAPCLRPSRSRRPRSRRRRASRVSRATACTWRARPRT